MKLVCLFTLLMMTAESVSKGPVLKSTGALFFLLKEKDSYYLGK